MFASLSKSPISFVLLAIFSLIFAVIPVAAFDCPCFTSNELDIFDADSIDMEVSCLESHATDSGLALVMKQSPDEIYEAPPVIYSVKFGHHQSTCMVGGTDIMTVPERKMAEDCADLIRSKCNNLGVLAEV